MTGARTPVIEEHLFADDGIVPNNPRLPLVVYRGVLDTGPDAAGACEVTHVYGRQEAHHVIMESKADYDERFADLSSLIEQVLPDAYQSSSASGRQG